MGVFGVPVVSARVVRERSLESRGFAYVDFNSVEVFSPWAKQCINVVVFFCLFLTFGQDATLVLERIDDLPRAFFIDDQKGFF